MGKKGKKDRKIKKAGVVASSVAQQGGTTNNDSNAGSDLRDTTITNPPVAVETEQFARRSVSSDPCPHGAPLDMKAVPGVTAFLEHFYSFNAPLILAKVTDELEKLDRDEVMRTGVPMATLKVLYSLGTHYLLDPNLGASLGTKMAHVTAMVTTMIESFFDQHNDDDNAIEMCEKIQQSYLKIDSRKRLVAYFADHIPCNCLAEEMEAVHNDRSEMCSDCCRTADDDTTLFDCTGCRLVKYCGRECQVKHWRLGHKHLCRPIRERLSQEAEEAMENID